MAMISNSSYKTKTKIQTTKNFDEAPMKFFEKKFLRSNPTPYPASMPRHPYAYSR
jgi:hypothetical protein